MKNVWISIAVTGMLLLMGLALGVGFHSAGHTGDGLVREKRYSKRVAEGVRYRDYEHLGNDLFSFKSCRVEKRRSGAITFGAFNVLIIDDLVVNLPVEPSAGREEGGSYPVVTDRLQLDGFGEAFLRSHGLGTGRFSGVRFNGFTVNRSISNHVERVFSAAKAESGTEKTELRLSECMVFGQDAKGQRVKEARLVLKPKLTLVYMKDGTEQRLCL